MNRRDFLVTAPVALVVSSLVADHHRQRRVAVIGHTGRGNYCHGKVDRRGGSEDLWVLGGYVFNLFEYFGGKPKSYSAIVFQNGRPVTQKDVVEGAETGTTGWH